MFRILIALSEFIAFAVFRKTAGRVRSGFKFAPSVNPQPHGGGGVS